MDFAVPRIWYGKVPAELTPTSTSEREEEEKGSLLLARAELSSYLYRLRTMRVNLSMLEGVHTTTV
jgi:hypothetical protein